MFLPPCLRLRNRCKDAATLLILKAIVITLISSFVHACKMALTPKFSSADEAMMGVSLTDQSTLALARCGQNGASILHSKLCGLY